MKLHQLLELTSPPRARQQTEPRTAPRVMLGSEADPPLVGSPAIRSHQRCDF